MSLGVWSHFRLGFLRLRGLSCLKWWLVGNRACGVEGIELFEVVVGREEGNTPIRFIPLFPIEPD